VKSFDPRRPPRSHFVSVAKRRFAVLGCHNRPFDATENRLIPVRLTEEIGFLVSIKRLVEALESACKSLHPGSIPGEASNQFSSGAAIRPISRV
jgi:hypothetical protein